MWCAIYNFLKVTHNNNHYSLTVIQSEKYAYTGNFCMKAKYIWFETGKFGFRVT